MRATPIYNNKLPTSVGGSPYSHKFHKDEVGLAQRCSSCERKGVPPTEVGSFFIGVALI